MQGSDKAFLKSFIEHLSIHNPIIKTIPTCASSVLITTSLRILCRHIDEISQILGEELRALSSLRTDYFETLSTHFTKTAIEQPLWSIGVFLESLFSLSDLLDSLPPEAECMKVPFCIRGSVLMHASLGCSAIWYNESGKTHC